MSEYTADMEAALAAELAEMDATTRRINKLAARAHVMSSSPGRDDDETLHGGRLHQCDCPDMAEPLSLLEQVDMEVAMLLAPPAWWGDDPFAGVPNAHDEWNEPL